MNRRRFLVTGTSGAIVGVSGCINDLQDGETNGSADGEPESEDEDHQPPDPKEFPDRPSELDPESVKAYVREYEEVYQHNSNVTPSTSGFYPNCSTVLDQEDEDGMYVGTTCLGSHSYTGGDDGSFQSFPALYRVTTEETTRIEPSETEHDEPYLTDDRGITYAHGLWLSNFTDQQRELELQLIHRENGQQPILDETTTLDATSGSFISNVTAVPGEYELHVELATGGETTEMLVLPEDSGPFPSPHDPLYAIHVAADDEIVARDSYFEDPVQLVE